MNVGRLGRVGELQTTIHNLQSQLDEAKAELKRAIESRPQASKKFKMEQINAPQRRRPVEKRARELEDKIRVRV